MPIDRIELKAGTSDLRANTVNAAAIRVNKTDGLLVHRDHQGTIKTVLSTAALLALVGDVRVVTGSLTNAQVLALRGTPITLVPAPGAGLFNELLGGHLFFDYTAAYTETDDDLAVKYTNGSGAAASATMPGEFLEATADAVQTIVPITALAVANAALVLHNTGAEEFGGGNAANVLYFRVYYRIASFAA